MSPEDPGEHQLTFGHARIELSLSPPTGPDHAHRSAALGVLALLSAPLVAAAAWAWSPLAFAVVLIFGPLLLLAILATALRTHLRLDPLGLTITRRWGSRVLWQRRIPLRDVRTVHATTPLGVLGRGARGLRIVLQDHTELILPAPSLPLASLRWLARQLRTVVAGAAADAADEANAALLSLRRAAPQRRADADQAQLSASDPPRSGRGLP